MDKTSLNIEVLELAAQTESLLNLYLAAKRELHLHAGITGVDPSQFPVVETVRNQIRTVRGKVGAQ
jgi:hypothetical protein